MLNWLYQTTIETSLLIGIVLVLRPLIRRVLGAKASYFLWLLPLIRIFFWKFPQRPRVFEGVFPAPVTEIQIQVAEFSHMVAQPKFDFIETIWLAGIFIFTVLFIYKSIRFKQKLTQYSCSYSAKSWSEVCFAAKISRAKGGLRLTDLPSAPFVTGLVSPTIYLPSDFENRFSYKEQAWVIAHELHHIRRKDLWVQLIAELVRILFWFNPIVHMAVTAMLEDQEYACDQDVLSKCNKDERYHYGKALMLGAGPQLTPNVLTFFRNNKERFIMLTRHKSSKLNSILGITLCAVLGLFAFTKAPESFARGETLSSEPVTMKFTAIDSNNMMLMLANASRNSLMLEKNVPTYFVTTHLDNLPMSEVWDSLMVCLGFDYQINNGSLVVSKTGEALLDGQCAVQVSKPLIIKRMGQMPTEEELTSIGFH